MFRLSSWLADNPVLQREQARRSAPLTRGQAVGSALGISFLWALYLAAGWLLSTPAVTPWQGRLFLLFACLGYLLFITLVVPGPAAALIAGERERETLQALLLTRIQPAQLVWGKLLVALHPAEIALLLAGPVLLMASNTARLPLDRLFLLLLLLAAAPVPVASVSLWLSGRCRSTRNATILSYLLAFISCWGTLQAFPPLLVRGENPWWYLSPAWQAAILCLAQPAASPLVRPLLPEWIWFLLGAGAVSAFFLRRLHCRLARVD